MDLRCQLPANQGHINDIDTPMNGAQPVPDYDACWVPTPQAGTDTGRDSVYGPEHRRRGRTGSEKGVWAFTYSPMTDSHKCNSFGWP